jgi:hypothetical protein
MAATAASIRSTPWNVTSITSLVTGISPARISSRRSSSACARSLASVNPIAAKFPFSVCAVRKTESIADSSPGSSSSASSALFRSVICSLASETNVALWSSFMIR